MSRPGIVRGPKAPNVPDWSGQNSGKPFNMWGGVETILANEVSVKGDGLPYDVAVIACPSPRAVRVTVELQGGTGGTFLFLVRCGLGRIELTRTLTFAAPGSMDIEVAARNCRVQVIASIAANTDALLFAALAPVTPWM